MDRLPNRMRLKRKGRQKRKPGIDIESSNGDQLPGARHLKAEKGLAYEIEKSIAANTLSRAAITMAALPYVNGA